MASFSARSITRLVPIGAAVLAGVIAIGLFVLERYREWPGASPSAAFRLTDATRPAGAGVENDSAPFGFAFLDQPRPLPDLHFADDGGRSRSLAEFHGRAIILNIWATWCIPCRKEMPTLDHLQAIFGGSDALVMPLSIDHQGPEVVKAFYRETGIRSLGIYVDQSGAASSALNVIGIPTTLLLDREGREIGRKIGPADWDSPDMVGLLRTRLQPRPRAPSPE